MTFDVLHSSGREPDEREILEKLFYHAKSLELMLKKYYEKDDKEFKRELKDFNELLLARCIRVGFRPDLGAASCKESICQEI